MNKFYFCPLPLLWIWGKTLRITSLTITLNKKTVNVILIMLITVVGVFLTNPVTKRCRRCRAMNIPFGRNKKNLQGKGGQQQQIIVSNFPQMFSLNSWKIQLHQLQTASNVIIFPFILAASVAQWSRPCRWSRFDWSPTSMAPVVINRYTIFQFFYVLVIQPCNLLTTK